MPATVHVMVSSADEVDTADSGFSYGRPLAESFLVGNAVAGECGWDQDEIDPDSNYHAKIAYGSYVLLANVAGTKRARVPAQFWVLGQDPVKTTQWTNFALDTNYSTTYTCISNGSSFKKYTATCSTCS